MTQVAEGVYRAGTRLVNWYLVEDGGKVTVVDAGVPGYWPQLDEALAAIGRSRGDVAALVLTHGDGDHVGFGERLRAELGVPVYVHGGDVRITTTKKQKKTEANLGTLLELRRKPARQIVGELARNGGLRVPPVQSVETFGDGDELDLPGRPRAVHTPGHSDGHCVIHLPDRGVAFAGDALCSLNVLTGATGPALMPPAMTVSTPQALGSLDRIAQLDAQTVLMGHGEPWTEGAAAAAEGARAEHAARG
jgi:glyoxylase-like metal-dependent hydrolase (beta-lactamase superfamily II)